MLIKMIFDRWFQSCQIQLISSQERKSLL